MILSPLIEESYLKAPAYCDSIGSDVGTLPLGVGILDIDNALLSPGILQAIAVDPSTRDAIDRCYRDFESFTPTGSLLLPHRLVPSTTMSDQVYPLAGQLEDSVSRLKVLPTHNKHLLSLLNKASKPIVRVCYMLFRRRGESTYYLHSYPLPLYATVLAQTYVSIPAVSLGY